MASLGEIFISVDVNEELAEIAAALLTIWLNFENGRSIEVVKEEGGKEKVVLHYNKEMVCGTHENVVRSTAERIAELEAQLLKGEQE